MTLPQGSTVQGCYVDKSLGLQETGRAAPLLAGTAAEFCCLHTQLLFPASATDWKPCGSWSSFPVGGQITLCNSYFNCS